MVLPVLMLDGQSLEGATPELLGLAMGIYGLTQALLQIPAGALSDRVGRKPVIIGGLIVFAIGSVIAALSDNIYGLILGRALQGGGAIASAIMALVTDLTREENRMKAMASIGASIGLSFSVALVIGPLLADLGGLQLIFAATAFLAVGGVVITVWVIPNQPQINHRDANAVLPVIIQQLKNREMWPLTLGVFLVHLLMVAIFVAIPLQLVEAGLSLSQHSWLYLSVLVVSFLLMVPFIIFSEKRQKMKSVVLIAATALALGLLCMSIANTLWHWVVVLLIYFWGFNLLEASLPSWLSKIAPAGAKGSAMGIYSSMQFFGAFSGGVMGGWVLAHYETGILFVALGVLVVIWAAILIQTQAPRHLISVRLPGSTHHDDSVLTKLETQPGVAEALYLPADNAIYLKVSANEFNRDDALTLIESTGEKHGS